MLDGSQTAKYGIRYVLKNRGVEFGVSTFGRVYRPEQLTTEVWDFVFFGGELPKDSDISEEGLL